MRHFLCILVLVSLLLATDASSFLKKHRRARVDRGRVGVPCTDGVCYDKTGGTEKCMSANGENTETEACDDPAEKHCCPQGDTVKSSIELGIDATTAMLSRIHAGYAYQTTAKSAATDPVFTDGVIIAGEVLKTLTQYDVPEGADPKNVEQNRCGPTTAIAAAINKGGDALSKLVEFAKSSPDCKDHQVEKCDAIKASIDDKSLTFGQLGDLEQLLYDCFGNENAMNGDTGTSGKQVVIMLKAAGIAQFNKAAKGNPKITKHEARFPKGESWGLLLESQGHWVLVGQTTAPEGETGKAFIYDPDSLETIDQVFYYEPGGGDANALFEEYWKVDSGWPSP